MKRPATSTRRPAKGGEPIPAATDNPPTERVRRKAQSRGELAKVPEAETALAIGQTTPITEQPLREPAETGLSVASGKQSPSLPSAVDLCEFAPVGFLSVNEKGSILSANRMSTALFGLERSRLRKRSLLPLLAPANRAAVRGFLERVFAGSHREFCEAALVSEDGPVRWVGLHGVLQPAASGTPNRSWLAVTDLTENHRSDAQLRASEIRYRRLFEAAHDGVLLLDPVTRKITDANPFMTRLLGYPRVELIGKELYEIGLLQDEAASQEMFRKLQRKHAVRYDDLPLANRDGRHQEVEVVANIYQEGGRPVIQCNIRDITQRKEAEEILHRNQALLSSLVEEAPLGMYVVNSRFQLVQANPPACAAFSNVNPLLGRDFGEVLRAVWPPRIAEQLAARFRKTLRTGEFYQSSQFAGTRQDSGERESYEWQIQRVPLPDGEPGVVCFFSDVTERNRLEAAGRRVAVLAAANTKLAAEVTRRKSVEFSLNQSRELQDRLLADAKAMQLQLRHLSRSVLRAQEEERRLISLELHDVIAQMLTGISLRLGNLGTQVGLGPEEMQRSIISTQELVARSVETVHQFARELRPSVLDDLGLVPALLTYMKSFASRTGLRTRLTACKEVDLLSVSHRTVLFRVAQEALTNVARHAGATGVEVVLRSENDGVTLQVTDDGRAFRVNKMLQATHGGRLGLIGMRERLEMVGGRLDIDSKPGVGTTISAHIPLPPPVPIKIPKP
jgi:PAS domain S-box-containing protein